jgi:hypothetical protein
MGKKKGYLDSEGVAEGEKLGNGRAMRRMNEKKEEGRQFWEEGKVGMGCTMMHVEIGNSMRCLKKSRERTWRVLGQVSISKAQRHNRVRQHWLAWRIRTGPRFRRTQRRGIMKEGSSGVAWQRRMHPLP